MVHPASAKKRHRQSLRRRERNRTRRSAARTAVRRARELIEAGPQEEAQVAIREAVSVLDRAAGKGVLHPNTAARSKSRLMHRFSAAQAPSAEEAAPPKRRTRTTAKTRASGARTKASGRTTTSRSKKS